VGINEKVMDLFEHILSVYHEQGLLEYELFATDGDFKK
jgi:hypothetical protein